MSFVIRQGTKNDVPGILNLIKDLAAFERAPNAVINTEEALERDGFGETPVFKVIVAEELATNDVIGMALYYMAYSTWKGRMYYLDDLIVTDRYRRMGIGKKLLDEFLKDARDENVSLVKWQVLDWNTPAIEFYKSMGVVFDSEWIDCKMLSGQITSYLDEQ